MIELFTVKRYYHILLVFVNYVRPSRRPSHLKSWLACKIRGKKDLPVSAADAGENNCILVFAEAQKWISEALTN